MSNIVQLPINKFMADQLSEQYTDNNPAQFIISKSAIDYVIGHADISVVRICYLFDDVRIIRYGNSKRQKLYTLIGPDGMITQMRDGLRVLKTSRETFGEYACRIRQIEKDLRGIVDSYNGDTWKMLEKLILTLRIMHDYDRRFEFVEQSNAVYKRQGAYLDYQNTILTAVQSARHWYCKLPNPACNFVTQAEFNLLWVFSNELFANDDTFADWLVHANHKRDTIKAKFKDEIDVERKRQYDRIQAIARICNSLFEENATILRERIDIFNTTDADVCQLGRRFRENIDEIVKRTDIFFRSQSF